MEKRTIISSVCKNEKYVGGFYEGKKITSPSVGSSNGSIHADWM